MAALAMAFALIRAVPVLVISFLRQLVFDRWSHLIAMHERLCDGGHSRSYLGEMRSAFRGRRDDWHDAVDHP